VATCGALQWLVNNTVVLTAIKGSDPTARVREMVFSREPLFNDITELCVAVLVAFGAAMSSLVVVFAFPFVILLQRSLRHSQLVNDSRIDAKTGLLNAGTWEREATAEVARASRTRNPIAVALIDIDHFKAVNDTYGHLVGDQVLKEISRSFQDYLREYDLAGRFGGEEFVLLLPHTAERDAYRIAERMRAHIAGMPIGIDGGTLAEPVHVTVSVGVAVLDDTRRDLTDLLASADAALYRAKQGGRNQVRMDTSSGASPEPGAVTSSPQPETAPARRQAAPG
jgi:diguanylate cyclase (GGDEF)-like protein